MFFHCINNFNYAEPTAGDASSGVAAATTIAPVFTVSKYSGILETQYKSFRAQA